VSAEALPALLADRFCCAAWRIKLRLDKNPVAIDAAAKPRGERLLRGKVAGDDN
jgi:hypothetical protein